MKILSAIFLFLILLPVSAQKELRDSIETRLESAHTIDSAYIDLLNDLSFEFIKSDPSASLPYINKAIRLADSINYTAGLVRATSNKGNSFWVIGLHDQALSYYLLALSRIKDANSINHARLNNNIGEVFKKKKLYDSAMVYYSQAWKIAGKNKRRRPSIIAYNIAETFLFKNNIDSSSHYYSIGKMYAEESNDKRGLAYANFGLAEIKFRLGADDEALKLMDQSLDLRLQIEDNRGAIQNYLKLAEYYLKKGNFSLSMDKTNLAKALSREVNAKDLLLEVSYLEYSLLTELKQYEKASRTLIEYEELKDSIRTHEFSNTVDKIKTSLLAELNSKENEFLVQEQKNSRRINESRLMVVIALAILIIISTRMMYQAREKRRMIKHQEEKDHLIDKLKSRNKNLEEFNSVISHNLREPLTQIIGYAKFYEGGNSGLETDEVIKHIKRFSFKIDQTIRDLSTVLNDKEPQMCDYRKTNLKKIILETLESFGEEINETRASVLIEIGETIFINSYQPFLHDIFYHLISNSLRFRSSDRDLTISLGALTKNDVVEITLKDNGIGMNMNDVGKKIFRMYQKFHSEKSGRGVGLHLVKNRVTALFGKVQVESEKNSGTTFTVTLPFN